MLEESDRRFNLWHLWKVPSHSCQELLFVTGHTLFGRVWGRVMVALAFSLFPSFSAVSPKGTLAWWPTYCGGSNWTISRGIRFLSITRSFSHGVTSRSPCSSHPFYHRVSESLISLCSKSGGVGYTILLSCTEYTPEALASPKPYYI
jgi:hypothetical protein